MTDKTGNSNMSSSRAHSRSTQPSKSQVSITVILPWKKNKFATTSHSKSVHQ